MNHRHGPAPGSISGIVLVLGLLLAAVIPAQEVPLGAVDPTKVEERLIARRQALAEERATIERVRQELLGLAESIPRQLAELQVGEITEAQVEQARVDHDIARLRQEDLLVDQTNTQRRVKELEQSIRDLEAREQLLRNPAKDPAEGVGRAEQLRRVSQALAAQREELALERQHLENLRLRLDQVVQRLNLTGQWRDRVEELYRRQQELSRREAQADLEQRLTGEQQAYQEEALALSRRLEREREQLDEFERRLLEARISHAEERARLAQLDIRLGNIANDQASLEALASTPDAQPRALQEGLSQARALIQELEATEALLAGKLTLGKQVHQLLDRREAASAAEERTLAVERTVTGDLLEAIGERQEQVQASLQAMSAVAILLETTYRERLRRDLLNRRTLPGTAEEGRALVEGFLSAPRVLYHQVRLSLETALKAVAETTALRWMGLLAVELALVYFVLAMRRFLAAATERLHGREDGRFSTKVLLTLALVLRRSLVALATALAVLAALWAARVPQPGFGIIATLLLTWVAIRAPMTLAWMLLASPRLPAEKRRPRIYRQVAWTLVGGGVLAAFTILAHLSSLPAMVVDAFDRLFMVYLLVVLWPLMRIRRHLNEVLAQRFGDRHWFIALRVVGLLLPLSLLGAAMLGLVGYLNLAWSVAWHLGMFILAVVAWLLARGVLGDLVISLKNFAVAHSGYGLLWTQEIISPLHKILEVALFLGAWVGLFLAYGWDAESTVVASLWAVLEQPLFTLGGAQISLWRLFTTLLTFMVVIWFGQWSRAVTYRWILSRISDLGVRHSLSVFTQYLVVLIGLLIILRMLGLDLTTLTVFAGAVGVGIGFGLQAISNNFVSGLILLAERPLRSGDVVKIGTNEGTITRIGMRSLTMKTFDNLEVIIPNSDVITNAFTNWTHEDNIIRTVLMIPASRKSDPHRVRELLEAAVLAHPAVLADPEPGIFVWEFGESSVNYRVQYFMDIQQYQLLKVRSEMVLRIWDALRAEGVEIPFPQRDLHLRTWPARAGLSNPDEPASPEDTVARPQEA